MLKVELGKGGVLSPVLFNLYVDDIINALVRSDLGRHIGHCYDGCLLYADDTILLSASLLKLQQVAQLSQRDRAAGWVSNGQKWKTGTERQYLRTIYVYIQPLRRIGPAKKSKSAKKRKIRAVTPFKVIQGHTRSSRSVPIESPYATSY